MKKKKVKYKNLWNTKCKEQTQKQNKVQPKTKRQIGNRRWERDTHDGETEERQEDKD